MLSAIGYLSVAACVCIRRNRVPCKGRVLRSSLDSKAPSTSLRLFPQLTGARQHLVLDLADGDSADRRIDPLAVVLQHLAEDADPHAIAAKLAPEDVGGRLEALSAGGGGGEPVGDDHAAKRIGRGQRHEAQRIERAAP